MRKVRAGFVFRPTKHFRVYIPVGGGGGKKSKKAPKAAAARSGAPRAKEAAAVPYEPRVGFGVLFAALGVPAAALAVWLLVSAVRLYGGHHGFLGTCVLLLFLAAGILAAGLIIGGVSQIRDAKAAGKGTDKQTGPAQAAQNGGTYSFVLGGNDSSERQALLHDLKIKFVADGVHGKLEMSENGAGFDVHLGETFLGCTLPEDSAWISRNFDSIVKFTSVVIRGGASDINGELRPFHVVVGAELKSGVPAPAFSSIVLPPCAVGGFYADGDSVVYVSSSGKIHTGNCGVGLRNCKAMLYEEALNAGYEECGNCFR